MAYINITTLAPQNDSFNMYSDSEILNDNFTTNVTARPPQDLAYLAVYNLLYNHLGPAICIFGMCCNVVNLVVLTQNQLPESPYTHLAGLACTDFSALMLSFIYMMFSKDSTAQGWKVYDAYIFIGTVNICTTSSIWITVLLTIERFLFVRHPLWAKDTCDRASAKVKILSVIAVACVFNIPRYLAFKPQEKDGKFHVGSTDFRSTDFFFVMNWMYSIFVHFVPLFILSCANLYLVYAVYQAGKQREKLHIRNNREAVWQREQRRLTITLISIVCLFIVCIIPGAFADRPIAFALFGGQKTMTEFATSSFYLSYQYVCNFLVWCNLSLNFILYCAFNEKFRRVMKFTATRMVKNFGVPFCRKNKNVLLQVQFKSGNSSTRNSTLHTHSLQHSKNETQPLQNQISKEEKKKLEEVENGGNLINHTV